jgi:hypothetical protein
MPHIYEFHLKTIAHYFDTKPRWLVHKQSNSLVIRNLEEEVVLTLFRSAKYSRRTGGGALWSGMDGPRHEAGRSATWREAAVPSGQARTVRDLAQELGSSA